MIANGLERIAYTLSYFFSLLLKAKISYRGNLLNLFGMRDARAGIDCRAFTMARALRAFTTPDPTTTHRP